MRDAYSMEITQISLHAFIVIAMTVMYYVASWRNHIYWHLFILDESFTVRPSITLQCWHEGLSHLFTSLHKILLTIVYTLSTMISVRYVAWKICPQEQNIITEPSLICFACPIANHTFLIVWSLYLVIQSIKWCILGECNTWCTVRCRSSEEKMISWALSKKRVNCAYLYLFQVSKWNEVKSWSYQPS